MERIETKPAVILADGSKSGSEPHYQTAEALTARCHEYFAYLAGQWHEEEVTEILKNGTTETTSTIVYDRQPEPPTITGLALYLGFDCRASLYEFKTKPEFSAIIRWAITRVENAYELALFGSKATSAVFALKNMGWNDKQLLEHTSKDGQQLNPVVTIVISPKPLARSEKDVDV
jgi:hypothetical protein